MTQSNIAPQAYKYVCACGGGCRSEEYLERHIATAHDPSKDTWYSIEGIWQLFGLPEGTHAKIGDVVPQYSTRMGAADFAANVAQWKNFLAERGIGKASVPTTSPDDRCVALTKSTGLRCDRRAEGGADICAPHRARPGRNRITVHPDMQGKVAPPTAFPSQGAPSAAQWSAPAPAAVPAQPDVAAGLAAIMQRLDGFDSRLTQMESGPPAPPAPPAPPVEETEEEVEIQPSGLLNELFEKLKPASS